MFKLSILLVLHVVYFIFEIHMSNFNVTYDFFFFKTDHPTIG